MLKKNQNENNNSSLATDAKDDLQQNVEKYLHSKLNDDKCLATERDKIIIHPIETNIFLHHHRIWDLATFIFYLFLR